jgi:hypothetical protein
VWVEGVALEDHGHVPVAWLQVVDHPLADLDVTVADRLESSDHAQRCGLAATGRTHQHEELPVMDLQVQIPHGDDLAVALPDLFERDTRHGSRPPALDANGVRALRTPNHATSDPLASREPLWRVVQRTLPRPVPSSISAAIQTLVCNGRATVQASFREGVVRVVL